ncbi:putative uncharacterized protein C7orf71 [Nomascus leucogenys]|uniref:putative uncharacterized protein C7orf71 n=1 Tax=Nomascus leucogenys TaxID=61853 RepID=UPI00122DB923|nr:putative uncharacterized protein C7orf71 [Nomascus leucogenys]
MGSCGWALTQSDWCPLKKRKRHQRCAHSEIRHVRTQRQGGHLQARERGLREANPAYALILDFQPPELQNLSEMHINHDLGYSSIIPMMKRAFSACGTLGLIMSGVFDNPGPIKNTLKKAFTMLWSFTICTRLECLRVALSNEETIPFIFHPKTQTANILSGPISIPMLL